jgi:hypothetical protein
MAATVTVAGFGTVAGAVYKPLEEIVPAEELPPAVPFTCQVTAVFLLFATVAMNCCSAPAPTAAEVGEMVTITAGAEGVLLLLPQLRNKTVRLAMKASGCFTIHPYQRHAPALMRFGSSPGVCLATGIKF